MVIGFCDSVFAICGEPCTIIFCHELYSIIFIKLSLIYPAEEFLLFPLLQNIAVNFDNYLCSNKYRYKIILIYPGYKAL